MNKSLIASYVGVVAIVASWLYFIPKMSHVGEYKNAETSPQVNNVPKEIIHPAQVQAYTKEAKKKLNLSESEQKDDTIIILAADKIPADDHPSTVVSSLDSDTGEVHTEIRRDPIPWLAAEQTGYIRIGYGIKTFRGKVGRFEVSENLLQIKAFHFGVDSTLDTDGQGYAGVHLEYRW